MVNRSNTELKDDGERMIPAFHKGNIMYGEHLGRYLAVSKAIKNKTVLDIASGSGYGTKLMAEHASFVYGVDIDEPSIEYSKLNFSAKNVEYRVGSGTEIPLEDNSVDAVISMETIEHIKDQETFLSEVKRVLKPNGFVVISTPNDKVYPKGNHFHVREHNKASLSSLLKPYFKEIKIHYQVVAIAAAVLHEEDLSKEDQVVNWLLRKEYTSKPDESIYYVVVCSDYKLPEIENEVLLSQEFSHMEQKRIADYVGDLHTQVNNLRTNLDHELSEAQRLTTETKNLKEEIVRLMDTPYHRFRIRIENISNLLKGKK
jgi:2-polyprenyl-3-methyl-5-hydroxy-6-metoxy-1,4-benzoquinol methylase